MWYTNYSSSEGLKHEHRVTEPPIAMTRAQPSTLSLGLTHKHVPGMQPQPAPGREVCGSGQAPVQVVQPCCRTPQTPLPCSFCPQRGWCLGHASDWGFALREKGDTFREFSSLSGNSNLICWEFSPKNSLLLHLPPFPFPLCLSSTLKSLVRDTAGSAPCFLCHSRNLPLETSGRSSLMQSLCLCPQQNAR